jgi:alkylhydroperoxidase/carboxymuconolactone decarboxylase family protein YurZ
MPEDVKPLPPDPDEEAIDEIVAEEQEQAAEPEPEYSPPQIVTPIDDAEAEAPTDKPVPEPSLRRRRAGKPSQTMKPFPKAPVRFFHDEAQKETGKPMEFFRYWKSLMEREEFRDRVVVYIYRGWPAMMDNKRHVTKVYDGVMMPDDILRAFGCGDYWLRLNDSGSKNLNITNCHLKNLGARQLNDFPPVLNIADLDFDDKSNQSYLLWARSRGMLTPEQEAKIKEGNTTSREERKEDDMANAEAVKQLASTVDRMADKMLNVAQNTRESQSSGETRLPEKLLDLMTVASASATQSAAKIMEESVKQVMELQKQNANPLANIKEVAGVLKDLIQPQPAAPPQALEAEKKYVEMIFQIQNERIRSLEGLIERMAQQQQAAQQVQNPAAVAVAEKPKSLIESLREMASAKEELRDLLGIDSDKPEEPAWMKYAPLLVQGLNVLGIYFANAMHNLAVAKTGAGQPEPVPAAPPPAAPAQEQATAPTMGEGIPAENQQQEAQNAMDRFTLFLRMIERPLLVSFNNGESGVEFAEKLIDLTNNGMFGPNATGRQVYDAVLEYGQDVVATLIKSYPPIWSVVSQTPQKWEKFLTEFFHADEVWAKEEEGDKQ